MSYFNHAFQKVFIGTAGYHNTPSETTADLVTLEYGLYDAKTFETYTTGTSSPFILASGSIYDNDKIGPFHGGYKESNKSKVINPRYITQFWKVEETASTQALTIVGKTNTAGLGACDCPEFLCGETYRLRLDIKGSPALRFLNHQVYNTLDAYTGCCTDPGSPTSVDPVSVMVQWAIQIINHPFLSQFISPVVKYTTNITAGSPVWVTLDTLAELQAYVPTTGSVTNYCTGLELTGAYVDTVFGDCSFSPMDHFEKEPIQIFASFVDDINNPCQSITVCSTQVTRGQQGQGYGETIIRELILSESYSQNYFNSDPRIREITQGNAIYDAITRASKYDVYYLQHSVPRFNNPSGTFDNDQYLLKIVIPSGASATAFETVISDALTAVNSPVTLETF
jgi:hypothetical protein